MFWEGKKERVTLKSSVKSNAAKLQGNMREKNLVNVEPESFLDRIHDSKARQDRAVKNYSPQFRQMSGQFKSRSTAYRLAIQNNIFLLHSICLFKALICSLYVREGVMLAWLIDAGAVISFIIIQRKQ